MQSDEDHGMGVLKTLISCMEVIEQFSFSCKEVCSLHKHVRCYFVEIWMAELMSPDLVPYFYFVISI